MALFMGYNANGGEEEPVTEPEGPIADEPEPEEEYMSRRLCLDGLWMVSYGYDKCHEEGEVCTGQYHMPESKCVNLTHVLDLNRCLLAGQTFLQAYNVSHKNEMFMCVYDLIGECPLGNDCISTHTPSDVEKQDLKELTAYGMMIVNLRNNEPNMC
jgi:hypothetical protein